jgi:hypothetical protein
MATSITFDCECGKPLKARPEAAGKKTRCPHCGTFVQIPLESVVRTAATGAAAGGPGSAKIAIDDDFVPVHIPQVRPAPSPVAVSSKSAEMAAVTAAAPAPPPAATAVTEIREPAIASDGAYKVLTSKDMGFVAKFDSARFEETLNHWGRKGWQMATAFALNIPTHTGSHDELIVILKKEE